MGWCILHAYVLTCLDSGFDFQLSHSGRYYALSASYAQHCAFVRIAVWRVRRVAKLDHLAWVTAETDVAPVKEGA
jgi:hypothetical protein